MVHRNEKGCTVTEKVNRKKIVKRFKILVSFYFRLFLNEYFKTKNYITHLLIAFLFAPPCIYFAFTFNYIINKTKKRQKL